MSEVVAIVEGQTEQAFVRHHLAAHLAARGITMWAQLPGRVARRGGARAWEAIRGDVLRTLKERRGRVCTTMFDFYAMPPDWPGRSEAAEKPLPERGACVERALLADLATCGGEDFRRELFIPYVQVHEFEALLFADVGKLGETLAPICNHEPEQLSKAFGQILAEAGGEAEAINDHQETCPSRRIGGLVRAYRKPLHGPIAAARIGLDALRRACRHFGQWLERLEALGA